MLVDSYDSFAYNLVQALESLGARVDVVQSSRCSASEIAALPADAVVLGPGPGRPEDAGSLVAAVPLLVGRVPLLGVCLGHQAIGLAFGGSVVRHRAVHGHATAVEHDGSGLFEGSPADLRMTRYHSLGVSPEGLDPALRVNAWSDDGVVMGLTHRTLPVHGVQFHPESVLSGSAGLRLLERFLTITASWHARRDPRPVRPSAPRATA